MEELRGGLVEPTQLGHLAEWREPKHEVHQRDGCIFIFIFLVLFLILILVLLSPSKRLQSILAAD